MVPFLLDAPHACRKIIVHWEQTAIGSGDRRNDRKWNDSGKIFLSDPLYRLRDNFRIVHIKVDFKDKTI
jgi:hypothetical protein